SEAWIPESAIAAVELFPREENRRRMAAVRGLQRVQRQPSSADPLHLPKRAARTAAAAGFFPAGLYRTERTERSRRGADSESAPAGERYADSVLRQSGARDFEPRGGESALSAVFESAARVHGRVVELPFADGAGEPAFREGAAGERALHLVEVARLYSK